jgi:hypothetical protein
MNDLEARKLGAILEEIATQLKIQNELLRQMNDNLIDIKGGMP